MLIMILIMAVLAAGLAYLFMTVNFIPEPASKERGLIDSFMQLLLAIAGVFFAIIMTVFVYSWIFFRRAKGDDTDARPTRGNIGLELTWTIIPLAVVIILSVQAANILDQISVGHPEHATQQSVFSLAAIIPREIPAAEQASKGNLVVDVTASRFAWQFYYPDYGVNSYMLEVPVDRQVVFNMNSKDVIHSFWVQQWGPKQDCVPGLSPMLRITPTKIGKYLVQCSQLCGYGHTDMIAPVNVVSEDDFNRWIKQQPKSQAPAGIPTSHVHSISLTAENLAFDARTLFVHAGAGVVVNFNNKDKGIPHNFSVYTDPSATKPIFIGDVITGPATTTYTFTAPTTPGDYFFRCDVHPTIMTGTFVVQSEDDGGH